MGRIERFDRYRAKWMNSARKEILKLGGTVIDEKNIDFHENHGDLPALILDAQPQAVAAIVTKFQIDVAIYTFVVPFAKIGKPLPAEIGTLVHKQLPQPTLHIFGRGWYANDDNKLQDQLNSDKELKKSLRCFFNKVLIGNTFYPYEYNMQTVGYENNTTYIGARPGISHTILGRACSISEGVDAIKKMQGHFRNRVGLEFGIRYKPHFGEVHFRKNS